MAHRQWKGIEDSTKMGTIAIAQTAAALQSLDWQHWDEVADMYLPVATGRGAGGRSGGPPGCGGRRGAGCC